MHICMYNIIYIHMYIRAYNIICTEEIGSGVCLTHIPTSHMIPSVAGSWSNAASVCMECRYVSDSKKWSPQP